MAHLRNRYLQSLLTEVLNFSPLVGILGHRQVGKTTLLELVSKEYVTLDDQEQLSLAQESAKNFLSSLKGDGTALDECQVVPSLFLALKEKVRKNKKPGQFILSGSVRFTSRKAIRESLMGRIINLELLPFSISEIKHLPPSDSIEKIITSKQLESLVDSLARPSKDTKLIKGELDHYMIRGGLPGICFIREDKLRNLKLDEQLNSILDRDLRMISQTTLSLMQIKDFLRELSLNQKLPIRYSHIEKKLKISEQTQKKLLYAFENLFLIRLLPIEGGRSGHIVLLEDQAEDYFFSKKIKSQLVHLEGLIYRNLRIQWSYKKRGEIRIAQYLTRGGARIPFSIETENEKLGILVIEGSHPNRSELASASSFLKSYANSKIVFTGLSTKTDIVDSRSITARIEDLI